MSRIIVAPAAEADALALLDYVAQDSPAAADRLREHLDELFHRLAELPLIGRSAEEIRAHLRVAHVASFLIFYQVTERGVEIARILHGAREILPELFAEHLEP